MSEFKKKRDSLEQFVKEQIIGPGAYNKKYFLLKNWESSEFRGQNLKNEKTCPALNNISELIPEVPAYQYSSGILFPETKELQETGGIEVIEEDEVEIEAIETSDENTSANNDKISEDTSESVIRKQQNYPNQLGLSFVVKDSENWEENLTVSFSFRKYRRIKRKECYENHIAIRVPEYEIEIKEAINTYFNTVFKTVEKDGNLFISPTQEIENETLYRIDYEFLNSYLKDKLVSQLNSTLTGISELKNKKGVVHFGIKQDEYSHHFYSIASNKTYVKIDFKNVHTIYDDTILNYIQNELEADIINYKVYKQLIKEIEIYNQLRELVTEIKSILKKGEATPVWESKHFLKEIMLPAFNSASKIFRLPEPLSVVNENDEDYKNVLDLKYSVQYFRKEKLNYVKLIIINKNYIELKANEPPQLNKKDKANELSYFGVVLKIVEKKPDCLQQYNPPQLLKIDQEDSFNKLIYRDYINYGEGYNTSVTWGKENGLNYIATDFLPSQETPDVGVVPSKIEGNKVVNRIEDDQVLSMRYLSTLTIGGVQDNHVLNGLTQFVDAYGGENGWIEEKSQKLQANPENLPEKAFELLKRQLEACKRDYLRLKRNIELLRHDNKAMAAFRTMNTAMFMQLHHSIKTKISQPFVTNDEAEGYYKTVVLEQDYKWRSFQLGFILLNIDAFVRPDADDNTVDDVFKSGWPERNEIADLVWFPTGGGKTEAYLGIIAFTIAYRRFTKGEQAYGTTVLMRYTLRMLTLQQFQRATLLICALEVIRKDYFRIPHSCKLGTDRITIGMFVGRGSLPNTWDGEENSMVSAFTNISRNIAAKSKISTNLPYTDCPWCGGELFVKEDLPNVYPNHIRKGNKYGIDTQLNIACNSIGCTFHRSRPTNNDSLPFRLFDEDIYKFPPTLLFGTVDKFAALANNISTAPGERNKDSRRLLGKGYFGRNKERDVLPPELIIQDELHLLLGPLGSSVGLFEKSIDALCTYNNEEGFVIKPKIVTSTATTRNTDKQIFALFNRRSEIFPKQGIFADDSFFAFNKRKINNIDEYESKRKYVGILPVGKTQVWMQLRIAAITLTHRLKYLKETYSLDEIFEHPETVPSAALKKVFDYYHTVLAYYNSLKDVGKTQSQLSHYLPGDVAYVVENTIPWSFMDQLIRKKGEINESELTGRLSGEEVKTNLADIEKSWNLISINEKPQTLNTNIPPEFVIATNMISVGIDVSRFNTMIISSMPRNVAEYIQASSRVARDEAGVVFTVHHPFRSRDISHYQRFKEFHEKFYSYVEPISVTPFASKALDRYLAMYAAVLIRHSETLGLMNNEDAKEIDNVKIQEIKSVISEDINAVYQNALRLEKYLSVDRTYGVKSSIDGIISDEEIEDLQDKLERLLKNWIKLLEGRDEKPDLKFRNGPNESILDSLFMTVKDVNFPNRWKVAYSLRDIGAQIVIKTVQQ